MIRLIVLTISTTMTILLFTGGLVLCFKKHDVKQEVPVEESVTSPLYILK